MNFDSWFHAVFVVFKNRQLMIFTFFWKSMPTYRNSVELIQYLYKSKSNMLLLIMLENDWMAENQ